MVVLAGHGTEAAHLPEQPLQDFDAAANVGGDELSGLLGKIKQNGAGFEDRDRRATVFRIVVDDGGNAVVR